MIDAISGTDTTARGDRIEKASYITTQINERVLLTRLQLAGCASADYFLDRNFAGKFENGAKMQSEMAVRH
jgi:hypothetical protein